MQPLGIGIRNFPCNVKCERHLHIGCVVTDFTREINKMTMKALSITEYIIHMIIRMAQNMVGCCYIP